VDSSRVGRALDLDLPAVAESCPEARHAVRAALAGTGVEMSAVDLAVTEAVTNVVLHAYRDRDPSDEPGRVRVTLDLDAGGALVVVVDDGLGMTPRDDTPGLGLGLSVIANVCDDLHVVQRADGTTVQMRFAFPASDPGAEEEVIGHG
jgi:serine/threonine-protein kinase RsbW/stage II sporulation protein AB (anti-sigma F factor)